MHEHTLVVVYTREYLCLPVALLEFESGMQAGRLRSHAAVSVHLSDYLALLGI